MLDPRVASYFDNAATTPLDPRVFEAMLPFLSDQFGNAHSIHQWGQVALEAVEHAREQVCRAIGADSPDQIVFTSGATESNNWLFSNFLRKIALDAKSEMKVWISPFEHSSIHEFRHNQNISLLPNQRENISFPLAGCGMVSCLWVNNETGTVMDLASCKSNLTAPTSLHSDITQALGKIPFSATSLDFASMSAHKLYGPKGIGALFTRTGSIAPLLVGGNQERGLRAGTLNVPAIVGFGAACDISVEERDPNWTHVTQLNKILMDELQSVPDWIINGGSSRSPYVLSLSFGGIEGESLVIEADNAGFGISAGAACSSGSTEPSHVLLAMGVPADYIRGTIRVSFSKFNSLDSTKALGKVLANGVNRLRSLRNLA